MCCSGRNGQSGMCAAIIYPVTTYVRSARGVSREMGVLSQKWAKWEKWPRHPAQILVLMLLARTARFAHWGPWAECMGKVERMPGGHRPPRGPTAQGRLPGDLRVAETIACKLESYRTSD